MPDSRYGGDTSPAERDDIQRRTLRVVAASQILGGAGITAGAATGALIAHDMLGSESLGGLPAALFTVGGALVSFTIGRISQRSGRRIGLSAGFAVGGLGAAGVVVAAATGHVWLLFLALFCYGGGTASNFQTRYAGTDLARPGMQGKAISVSMLATAVGVIVAPNLIGPLGTLAEAIDIPPLVGPFLLAAFAYFSASAVMFAFLRPDPFLVSRGRVPRGQAAIREPKARTSPGAKVGAGVMMLAQFIMMAIVTMTPVHMRAHDHPLAAVGVVVSVQIGSMFVSSLVTGVLVDRIGRLPMAALSGVLLLSSGLVLTVGPSESLAVLMAAFVVFGFGWNSGLIAGSAIVVDSTPAPIRPRVQGSIDVLVTLTGALGGGISGLIVAAAGFEVLALGCGVLALLPLPLLAWARRHALVPRS